MILADAHVHIYDCFDLEKFFNAAWSNFKWEATRQRRSKSFSALLLLTESKEQDWFNRLFEFAKSNRKVGDWSFFPTKEECSLSAVHENEGNLYIIAGHQIVTSESIEVLALGDNHKIKEGRKLSETIELIKKSGAIPVLPWGAGKWFGRRGRILKKFLHNYRGNDIFLGDNGCRPVFWPTPSLFQIAKTQGLKILPGSDPLPFPTESTRAGSFGFNLHGSIDPKQPAKALKVQLKDTVNQMETYGKFERPYNFIRNQIAMQLLKYDSKSNN